MRRFGFLGCLGLVAVVVVVFGFYVMGARNSLVRLDENVETSWAQVQNVYQRRADLVPNLVNTVKGYAAHEKSTLEAVIKARSQAVNPAGLPARPPQTPEEMAQFESSQGALTSALSRLLVVVERYPELKANENFLSLQSQLEGTENRITVERQRYNETVRDYNVKLRSFPSNVVAGIFNFDRRSPFQAKPGSEVAPVVDFGTGDERL